MNLTELTQTKEKWIEGLITDELAANTVNQYNTTLNKFIDFMIANDFENLNKETVIAFKNNLSNEFAISTVNTRLTILNKFFKQNDLNNLAVKLLKQQKRNTLDDMITETDYKKLITACKKFNKERTKLIIETLVATGIRYSELAYITVEAITKYKGIVKVENKGKIRTITMPKSLIKDLKAYCKANDIQSGIIFHGRNKDKLIGKTQLWNDLKEMAGKAKIKKSKIHAHSFRHLFAKRAIDSGFDITDLADLLGHSSLETTRIYTRKTAKEQQQALEQLHNNYNY